MQNKLRKSLGEVVSLLQSDNMDLKKTLEDRVISLANCHPGSIKWANLFKFVRSLKFFIFKISFLFVKFV